MILVAGIPSEPPVRLAVEAAVDAGVEHVVLNQREAHRWAPTVVVDASGVRGHLVVDGRSIDLERLTGVYWRLMDAHALPENAAGAQAAARARSVAVHEAVTTWVETADCRVANRIGPMSSNASKPYQAALIAQSGLATPDTVVTTRPEVVEQARARWGPTVYKSVSSVRSIVRELDDGDDLDAVAALATQFQRRVDGTDVRVHVVGDDLHATRIDSDAVDYRYARREHRDAQLVATELPDDVAARCRDLARRLRLPFCGIDLRRTPDGEWVCFEVNPSPGYSYYQQHTGQPISHSLVAWLARAA